MKFGNKLSKRHIEFKRLKIKVNVAAQTLSSSVADAMQFLMQSPSSGVENAGATIEFIRVLDRVFDILNSKNLLAPGFKCPLKRENVNVWFDITGKSIEYLQKLRDIHDSPLYKHRRKTFVIDFIVALKSVRNISLDLVQKRENPYSFVLTYKFSQDHLELLFGCIRGKNGWNNNPDLRSALQRILLRVSNIKSSHYNCLVFEKDASPIFSLKWTKKRSPFSGTDNQRNNDIDDSDFGIYHHTF